CRCCHTRPRAGVTHGCPWECHWRKTYEMDTKYCKGPTVSTLHTRTISGASSLWYTYCNWRYAILFYSLLLTLAVVPLRRALGLPPSLLELFLAMNLLAAVTPIRSRKIRRVLLPFLVVALVVRGGTAWLDQGTLESMNLALWTVVALLA